MVYEEKRTVKINLKRPTKTKHEHMLSFLKAYQSSMSIAYEACQYWDEIPGKPEKFEETEAKHYKSPPRFGIQHFTYNRIRTEHRLPAQLALDSIKDAVAAYKNNEGSVHKHIPISYNIPRSGNFGYTDGRRNSVLTFRCFDKRVAVPITQDNAFQRLTRLIGDGYTTSHFRVGYDFKHDKWYALVVLKKDWDIEPRTNILGIDIGSRTLAATSILDRDGNITDQRYFGRDLWTKQRDISLRRSKLKSHLSPDNDYKGRRKAKRYLSKLRRKEHNYVKTRSFQLAHEIADLAKANGCTVSMENLTGLKDRKNNSRRANRRSKRIPYHVFTSAMKNVGARNGIGVVKVKPHGTSTTCSRCGSQGVRRSDLGYKVFTCPGCGYTANADRNASVNIARRAENELPDFFINHTKDSVVPQSKSTTGSLAVAPDVCSAG